MAYIKGKYGLDHKDNEIQKEGLRLAKKFALTGCQKAIDISLKAYLAGFFGLNTKDEDMKEEAFRWLETLALQGIPSEIGRLLTTYKLSASNLTENGAQEKELEFFRRLTDGSQLVSSEAVMKNFYYALKIGNSAMQRDEIVIKAIDLALKLAETGSQYAILFLLNFGLVSSNELNYDKIPSSKEGWIALGETYADKGFEIAISYLLDADISLEKKLQIANKYAPTGSKAAIDYSFKKGINLAVIKECAEKGSEDAIFFLLKHFFVTNDFTSLLEHIKKYLLQYHSRTAMSYLEAHFSFSVTGIPEEELSTDEEGGLTDEMDGPSGNEEDELSVDEMDELSEND